MRNSISVDFSVDGLVMSRGRSLGDQVNIGVERYLN